MTYIAIYRKYRSQTFEDVVGQEHVTKTLQNSIERGSVGQAYLFTGSRGTGKTTVARLLAKAVNCEKGPTPQPCNTCGMCMAITQGSAVDVAEIDAASNRGVAEMETICEGVRYRPMEARYRVVILDEAHQLSDHAKDAFLKTLEEPPGHAIFVLATTEPSKIPITIRSRCQQFDFHRGSLKQVEDRLLWVAQQEDVKLDENAARLIAVHAQGSWRDGLSLLEQVIAFAGTEIGVEEARKVLGAVPEEVTAALFEAVVRRDPGSTIEQVKNAWDNGADPTRLLSALIEHSKERLEDLISGRKVSDACGQVGAQNLIALIYKLAEAQASLRNWERADIAIEVALLGAMADSVAAAPANEDLSSVPAPPPSVRPQRKTSTPPPPGQQEPSRSTTATVNVKEEMEPLTAPLASPESVDLDMLARAWPRVIQNLRTDRTNTSLCAILKDGKPAAFDNGVLQIIYPVSHKFHAERTEQEANRIKIQAAFKHVAGVDIRIRASLSDSPPAATGAPIAAAIGSEGGEGARTTREAQALPVNSDSEPLSELVEEVLRTFGGEVLDEKDPFST